MENGRYAVLGELQRWLVDLQFFAEKCGFGELQRWWFALKGYAFAVLRLQRGARPLRYTEVPLRRGPL
jgi:hypothetical protein